MPIQFNSSPSIHRVAFLHSGYFLVTGIWPLIDISSFMWITGLKHDIWLVKTVGLLIVVTGGVILLAAINRRITFEIFLLAACSSLALAFIDVYYALKDVISTIYLADAAGEIVLIFIWFLFGNVRFNKVP